MYGGDRGIIRSMSNVATGSGTGVIEGAAAGPLERTFLIGDVRGYTSFTRERGDAEAARLAKRFAEVARDSVEARNGRVIELRGDEVLAVFTSPDQAVRAAVELQAVCEEEVAADPTLPLLVGVGIDVGEAVPVEDGFRGAALNTAARLCSKAAAGQVLVTSHLADRAGAIPGLTFASAGSSELKGFEQPVELIEVIAHERSPVADLRAPAPPLPIELELDTPLVGREHELAWLRGTWRQARRSYGRVVFVSGPAKTGKSRLASFGGEDARLFFGRERLVGELAARTVGVGLLAVVGASGSGKSSVIAAGLVPSLRAGLLPGSERWRSVVMRPGEHPLAALDSASPSKQDGDERLRLVIDQFEELFTTCQNDEERSRFVDQVVALARDPERAVVVLALRADFSGECAAYPELAELLAANLVLVGPMSSDELRRAVELPARRAGLRVESSLAEAVVTEIGDEPGGLPLLSTALVELWMARSDGWLKLEAHETLGGVRGAVARLADSSYENLTEGERSAARRLFMRLVSTGEEGALARRTVPLSELDLERDPVLASVVAPGMDSASFSSASSGRARRRPLSSPPWSPRMAGAPSWSGPCGTRTAVRARPTSKPGG